MREYGKLRETPEISDRIQAGAEKQYIHKVAEFYLELVGKSINNKRSVEGKNYRISQEEKTITITNKHSGELLYLGTDKVVSMFLKQSLSVLISLGSLAVCLTLPTEAASLNRSVSSIAQVRHNNGSLIALNGKLLPFASDFFPVQEDDIIEMNRGFTDLDLLITDSDKVLWNIQIFPGDSLASFSLEDYLVNTDQSFTDVTNLPSGNGNVIAYGFDPQNSSSVVLRPFLTESQPVPEASTGLGILIAVGIAYTTRKKNT